MNDVELEVVARWSQGQSQRGIAIDLKISRTRVREILLKHQHARKQGSGHPDLPRPCKRRGSQLDAFQEQIEALLLRYPKITVKRIFEELQRSDYRGSYSLLAEHVGTLRARPKVEPVIRFETAPGAQGQMDYAVYDIDFTSEGRRRVNLFSYVLGYSRRQYLHFTESQDFETTLREHVRAFEHLQGVPASCLYDNMKVVVQRWENDYPVYNTRFLAFATHYGFRPVACRPRRPQTKGKVERPFGYIESNLLNGRTFRTLEHLNDVTRWWLANVADVREHRTTKKTPIAAHAEEVDHLLPLPEHHYDTAKVVYRVVSAEGYIDYRQNAYSAPWKLIGLLLPVRVTEHQLTIYDQQLNQIATHELFSSQVRGQSRTESKHRPREDQGLQLEWLMARFAELGEPGPAFLQGLIRKQRYCRQQAKRILELQRHYRRQDLVAALERAVRFHAFSLAAVERILSASAAPKMDWTQLTEDQQELLRRLSEDPPTEPRPTSEYQYLLPDSTEADDDSTKETGPADPPTDLGSPGEPEDPADK